MSWDLKSFTDIFSFIANLVIIVGGVAAVIQYYYTARQERRDIEFRAFESTDQAFKDYQKLCLENSKLDIFDVPDESPEQLTTEEKKKEVIAFTMLFSVFELAYFTYDNYKSKTVNRQWIAWDEYIKDFCKRPNFIHAWKVSGETFDPKFQEHMKEKHHLGACPRI